MLGNNNKTNRQLYYFQLRSKDDGKTVPPYFRGSRPPAEDGGDWEQLEDKYTQITGHLTQIKLEEKVWEGVPTKSVRLRLDDGDETYLVKFNYTKLGRAVFNSILNLESLDDPMQISVYINKQDKTGASVRVNNDVVAWKYGRDDLPQPTEHTIKGQKIYDYTEVENFIEDKLKEFADKFGLNEVRIPAKSAASSSHESDLEDEVVVDDSDDDDAIF